jgi:putative ABC transport system permease protein
MTLWTLIWTGLCRRPVRTVLIILQIAIAFGLFGLLEGMQNGARAVMARARADLLFTDGDLGTPLPLAYWNQIAALPGVKSVSYQNALLVHYQRPTQGFGIFAVEIKSALATIPVGIAPEQAHAMETTTTGAIASVDLARRFGWKIGDRIPVQTDLLLKDGGHVIPVDLVGMFTPVETNGTSEFMVINNAYLDALRIADKGTVEGYSVSVSDPSHVESVAQAIDALFANSPYPTHSQSHLETAQLQLKTLNDLQLAVGAIAAAAFFALLVSVGAILAIDVRERAPEFAVLKVLGFSNSIIVRILLAETVLMCAAAAAVGLGLAELVFPRLQRFMLGLSMPNEVIVEALAVSLAVALVANAIPLWRVLHLRATDVLLTSP